MVLMLRNFYHNSAIFECGDVKVMHSMHRKKLEKVYMGARHDGKDLQDFER